MEPNLFFVQRWFSGEYWTSSFKVGPRRIRVGFFPFDFQSQIEREGGRCTVEVNHKDYKVSISYKSHKQHW